MKRRHAVVIAIDHPPVVELDSEAHAAYIRIRAGEVVTTEPVTIDGCIITVDYDADHEPLGIELIGVDEFGIVYLLKKAGFELPKKFTERAKYVPANLQPA